MVHEFWQVVVVLVLPFNFEPRSIKYKKNRIMMHSDSRLLFLDYDDSKTITYEMWSNLSSYTVQAKNHRPDGKISRLPGAAIWQEHIPCDSTKQRTLSVLLAESPWWHHHACVSQGKSKHTPQSHTHPRAAQFKRWKIDSSQQHCVVFSEAGFAPYGHDTGLIRKEATLHQNKLRLEIWSTRRWTS